MTPVPAETTAADRPPGRRATPSRRTTLCSSKSAGQISPSGGACGGADRHHRRPRRCPLSTKPNRRSGRSPSAVDLARVECKSRWSNPVTRSPRPQCREKSRSRHFSPRPTAVVRRPLSSCVTGRASRPVVVRRAQPSEEGRLARAATGGPALAWPLAPCAVIGPTHTARALRLEVELAVKSRARLAMLDLHATA